MKKHTVFTKATPDRRPLPVRLAELSSELDQLVSVWSQRV